MQNKSAIRTVIMLAIFAIALMVFTMYWHKMQNKNNNNEQIVPATPMSAEVGTVFPNPRDIHAFQLMSSENKNFSLKNLQNHWTLLFFGFTHCPDVCPTTMALLNQVYPQLTAKYPSLQVVLVTVDPKRDKVKTLNTYLKSFNPKFIGLTGKDAQIMQLQKELGVTALHSSGTHGEVKIEHTASIYLINPEGKWAALLPYGLGVDEFVSAFEKSARA